MAWAVVFIASRLLWVFEKLGHPALLIRDIGHDGPSLGQSLSWGGICLVIFLSLSRFVVKPLGAWFYSRDLRATGFQELPLVKLFERRKDVHDFPK
jgi:hypothetical protein